ALPGAVCPRSAARSLFACGQAKRSRQARLEETPASRYSLGLGRATIVVSRRNNVGNASTSPRSPILSRHCPQDSFRRLLQIGPQILDGFVGAFFADQTHQFGFAFRPIGFDT